MRPRAWTLTTFVRPVARARAALLRAKDTPPARTGTDAGSMGEPATLIYQGQQVKFCCSGCQPEFGDSLSRAAKLWCAGVCVIATTGRGLTDAAVGATSLGPLPMIGTPAAETPSRVAPTRARAAPAVSVPAKPPEAGLDERVLDATTGRPSAECRPTANTPTS